MIAPLARYPIRGVLWYQGESDTSNPLLYRKLFPSMITSWRKAWNQGNLPFLYVQLPGFLARHPQPTESRWAALREAQLQTLSTPGAGMAVTIDLGDPHNMHPANKQDVAHRLALIAENQVYGKSGVTASGPVFSGMEIQDGKAILSFTHVDSGLTARNGPALKGFAIAGNDRNFVWADAQIRAGKVIVQSKAVPKPVAVRYAWADNPDCDLFNKENLPASPFRTDDWTPGESPSATPSPAASPSKPRKHHAQP
jgi:sialate O-acetylesterase